MRDPREEPDEDEEGSEYPSIRPTSPDEKAFLKTFGRIAFRQNLKRIDDLTKRIEELSALDGMDMFYAPMQFNFTSPEWTKCLYFVLLLFGNRVKPNILTIQRCKSRDDDVFSVSVVDTDNGFTTTHLRAAKLLEMWNKARPLEDPDGEKKD